MISNFILWLHENAPLLFREKVPLWFTIFAGLAAATGAYFVAPAINRRFKIDEARSAHVSKTTVNLNGEIILLSQKIRRLNDALLNKKPSSADLRQDCLDLTTKLQWMLVDLKVVLKSTSDIACVDELGESIGGLKSALDRAVDEKSEDKLLSAMRTLAESTRCVLDRLYIKASLK